jgi:hypothetical protein
MHESDVDLTATVRPVPATAGISQAGALAAIVPPWSGLRIRALRESMRFSVREFAAYLRVSDQVVSQWETGVVATVPHPINQEALDTCLSRLDADSCARFRRLLTEVVDGERVREDGHRPGRSNVGSTVT